MPGTKLRYAERSKSRLYKLDQIKDRPKKTSTEDIPIADQDNTKPELKPEVEETTSSTGEDSETTTVNT